MIWIIGVVAFILGSLVEWAFQRRLFEPCWDDTGEQVNEKPCWGMLCGPRALVIHAANWPARHSSRREARAMEAKFLHLQEAKRLGKDWF